MATPTPSDQTLTLPAPYLRQIAQQLERMGAGLPDWFRDSALAQRTEADAVQTLPLGLFERLVHEAIERSGEPAFGLLVGERLAPSSHGILGFAAMNSASVRQAVEVLERFLPMRTTLLRAHHAVVGEELRLIIDEGLPLGTVREPVFDAVLLTLKNLFDNLTLGACPIHHVAFAQPEPAHAGLARDLFGCPLRYGSGWAGIAFKRAHVDQPLALANPAMFQQARELCERELAKATGHPRWVAQVRRLMLESQRGFPSLNVTARLFNLTPRTLHRRLVDEGSSFREVVDEVRHSLALAHLRQDGLSIQEIAFQLGYTDLANFRRAFKRWESVSPSAYRAAAQTKGQRP